MSILKLHPLSSTSIVGRLELLRILLTSFSHHKKYLFLGTEPNRRSNEKRGLVFPTSALSSSATLTSSMSSLARFLLRHRKRTKRKSRQYSGRLPQDFEHSVIARRLNEEGRCRKSASSSWKTFATQQMSRRHQPGGLTLMNKLT